MPRKSSARSDLCTVQGGRKPSIAEALLQPTPPDPDAAEPLPHGKKLFAKVPFDWLADRTWDGFLPQSMRLYLYLQIKSRRGARAVRLTTEMAAEVGLDRRGKVRALRALERHRLISITREKRTGLPKVSVCEPAPTPNTGVDAN
jgi:hypothetical protein